MLAFKGFNENLTCTMGHGIFQYEIGKKYKEKEANCTKNGFHCCENPLDVLDWYSGQGSRFCVVEAEGEINQDNVGTKISCTKMTIVKEITRREHARVNTCGDIRRELSAAVICSRIEENAKKKMDLSLCGGKIREQRRCWAEHFFFCKKKKTTKILKRFISDVPESMR